MCLATAALKTWRKQRSDSDGNAEAETSGTLSRLSGMTPEEDPEEGESSTNFPCIVGNQSRPAGVYFLSRGCIYSPDRHRHTLPVVVRTV